VQFVCVGVATWPVTISKEVVELDCRKTSRESGNGDVKKAGYFGLTAELDSDVTNCRLGHRSRSPRKPPTSFTLFRNLDGLDAVPVFIDEAKPEQLLVDKKESFPMRRDISSRNSVKTVQIDDIAK